MSAPHFPHTRGAMRLVIDQAETCVQELRTQGQVALASDELADLLEPLALVARRRMDPDYEPEPDQYHGGEDLVTDDEDWE
jgi:hypothetical protein